jgi:hypothetical protein
VAPVFKALKAVHKYRDGLRATIGEKTGIGGERPRMAGTV